MNNGAQDKRCEIWAIGGGKGGTGKSFVTSSIGTHLASKGNKVVLIDADLGGANLHTLLGVSKPRNSLTDFFERKASLNDIIVIAVSLTSDWCQGLSARLTPRT